MINPTVISSETPACTDSIFRRALGSRFQQLHPALQRRLDITSSDGVCAVGSGVMDQIITGPWYMQPFLALGARRRIMFPGGGENIGFTIRNYAWRDTLGRETYAWIREFSLPTPRRFDETMVYSEKRRCVLCYCGTHQHLCVEMRLEVEEGGALRFRSGAQRLCAGPLAFRFPLLFSGIGDILLSFDEARNRFAITVSVSNRVMGSIIRYSGWFEDDIRPCSSLEIPADARPIREQRRE